MTFAAATIVGGIGIAEISEPAPADASCSFWAEKRGHDTTGLECAWWRRGPLSYV